MSNYAIYKTIIAGREHNPFETAKMVSNHCTEFSQRQLVKRFVNSSQYYYRAQNDNGKGLGLHLRVENNTGKIMEFMMVHSPTQIISGVFTESGQLIDLIVEDRKRAEQTIIRPDYKNNILFFKRTSPRGVTQNNYNINADGTFSLI